ncbi:unnamed protein product [Bursaphelenchus xylophilus]|uniref:(pine wood nematode) hypothetical protein n=1 Tax=Bursaphelenchus xylophilus TaxID=6326 RepID=A0A1I7S7L2_BURXY|nr:unnamed protein product [Bursaphelenchus xylophilus]CAG9111960.1 unnamed protein product [Bursaphelenchus xylophilus]
MPRNPLECPGFPRLYGINTTKPANLERLLIDTQFSRTELRQLYRHFKDFCPNGVLSLDQLKQFYAQIFPKGKSEEYACFVHRAFDLNNDGNVDFEDLAITYSILTRGTAEDRAEWVFNFYDSQKEDRVGRIQLLSVMKSIYGLLGDHVRPVHAPAIFSHMCEVFERITKNESQFISRQQFLDYILNTSLSESTCTPRNSSNEDSVISLDSRMSTENFVTPYSSQFSVNDAPELVITPGSSQGEGTSFFSMNEKEEDVEEVETPRG